MHIFKLFLKGLEKFWTKTTPAPGNRAFHEREKGGGFKAGDGGTLPAFLWVVRNSLSHRRWSVRV
jgi:hypothetical protein